MTGIPGLLREIRALELVARRNVSSMLSGNYRTTIIGRGLDFHEARRYVPGDPVRSIDWKITARLNSPHIKTFIEERQREIIIALDVSPSMHTGWQRLSKIEAAVEMAATLALSAVESGDRLGWVTFSDRTFDIVPPRQGRKQLFAALRAFIHAVVDEPHPSEVSDPRAAFHAVQAFKGKRAVIFVISDFIDHDIPDDLRYIARRHDVSLLHIYDPLEYTSDPRIRFVAHSPEGRRSPSARSLGDFGTLEAIETLLHDQATSHAIATPSFSTGDPIGPALTRFFHHRRTERRG